jgi:CheY-like chemotaxis protein
VAPGWSPFSRLLAAGEETRLDGMTILVVDDQLDSREMLAALLEQSGARIVQCESAESALGVIDTRPFEAVVADIAMPQVDGYEFIRRLRATGSTTPAVAVTAFAQPEDRHLAMSSGYDAYCSKPIDRIHLTRILSALMASSKAGPSERSEHR